MESCSRIAEVALDVFVIHNHLFMQACIFSLIEVETKKRNILGCENDMRLALSKTNI